MVERAIMLPLCTVQAPTSPSACSRLFTLASHSAPPIHTATLSQDPRPPRDAEVCNGLT